MPRENSFSLKSVPLIILLIFVLLWNRSDSQVNREEANKLPDGRRGDGSAFFAMRSCQQLLRGDAGEFFSPDYLCSNPPLWCNWTIKVEPGKRIHLHLEDLTPNDGCSLKEDQIHVDEPAAGFRGHAVLQQCWREAKYTSISNTLYVVLLIGGWPSPPYRGFHGRYQAFGPPVVYDPRQGFEADPAPGLVDFGEIAVAGERLESGLPEARDGVYDYYGLASSEEDDDEWGENQPPEVEIYNRTYLSRAASTVSAFTQGTSRSERGAAPTTAAPPDTSTTTQVSAQEGAGPEEERSAEASDSLPASSEAPEPEGREPPPNVVEPLSDRRGNLNIRNRSEIPHLARAHLFEVALEVNFRQGSESLVNPSGSLLLSVKSLVGERLKALGTPLSMSSKRIKRLSKGLLYILWLQIGQKPGGAEVREVVRSRLEGLIATEIDLGESHVKAVLVSVSIADVNECDSQLVLCDANADCVDQFGSYSCRCRPGFQDTRLGSGGGADVKAAGCSLGMSAETKGVYVLFFLLSFLVLMLMAVAGLLYHRRHRGEFVVRCNSAVSHPDHHQRRGPHHYNEPDLPPPPPPARSFREAWPQGKERYPVVDLPLLSFSPLLPPDGYREPREGVKM
ncbi:uncharacterized protein zgc:66455 isoform X1 [Pungitius pungitius]|uniref:uncharacterized protein zgc:66455 isoform X1 n=1 Tax=Pungitius pungitius TaxID=134920 RepID=UPI002E165EBD